MPAFPEASSHDEGAHLEDLAVGRRQEPREEDIPLFEPLPQEELDAMAQVEVTPAYLRTLRGEEILSAEAARTWVLEEADQALLEDLPEEVSPHQAGLLAKETLLVTLETLRGETLQEAKAYLGEGPYAKLLAEFEALTPAEAWARFVAWDPEVYGAYSSQEEASS